MNDQADPLSSAASQLVIITGMSGAGRSTAANVLEDRGWYVIDNLPPQLLVSMASLLDHGGDGDDDGSDVRRLCAVVDVRSRTFFTDFRDGLDRLRAGNYRPIVVFMDATDEALVRRFESVRRPHPLQGEGRLLDGIVDERVALRDLRAAADVLIDTSGLNVHQLSTKVREMLGDDNSPDLRVAVMSFGFKYGIPLDADIVFDMRFLPNPFWNPDLRPFTGQDRVVSDFVLAQSGATEFLERALAMLEPVFAGYRREGRSYVTLAVGCTGGKHRSVAITEALAERLGTGRTHAVTVHRDLGRE
ncbi:RNase adapter RapZ [Allobranchiibius sp. CTAmp26]|uniref:RNase adapter RapZ n=1 Tax=Allobranchiibius sp. CTAmp26 TaxID=2815214 RepID=UPI001AA0EDDB|nr:RNase adapter RapZ [Allobranchiibius sp. CTAmp26]MBO1754103.1 RNase adapter RapZ [Allobranchiibius sp. CTAmp26]